MEQKRGGAPMLPGGEDLGFPSLSELRASRSRWLAVRPFSTSLLQPSKKHNFQLYIIGFFLFFLDFLIENKKAIFLFDVVAQVICFRIRFVSIFLKKSC